MGRLLFVTVTTVLSPRSQVRARQQFGGLDIVNLLLRDGDSSAACVRDAEPDEHLVEWRLRKSKGVARKCSW